MELMDSQEREVVIITLRERRHSTNFSNFVALICNIIDFETYIIQGVADQQGWRNASMWDDVCDIV
jgi:hypothetical protein